MTHNGEVQCSNYEGIPFFFREFWRPVVYSNNNEAIRQYLYKWHGIEQSAISMHLRCYNLGICLKYIHS